MNNQKGLAPMLIVLILAVALVGGYLVYQNQTKPTPSPQPTTQPSPTSDSTANWKTYNGTIYSFQYPPNWTVAGGSGTSTYEQVVDIGNSSGSVKITLSPFQYPYGFEGNPEMKKGNTIKIIVEGKEYNATETIINNSKAYVDLKVQKNKENHILFGTGYPAGNDNKSSLTDYAASKDDILKIISTLKIKD